MTSVQALSSDDITKVGVIVIVVMGIMPGLGGIIGTGDHGRAIRLRGEINSFIWLAGTALGASILVWNRIVRGAPLVGIHDRT